jgi:hypothetical protein
VYVNNFINGLSVAQFVANSSMDFDSSLTLTGVYSYVGVLIAGTGSDIETLGNAPKIDSGAPNGDCAVDYFYTTNTVYFNNEVGFIYTDPIDTTNDAVVVSGWFDNTGNGQIFVNGVNKTAANAFVSSASQNCVYGSIGFGDFTYSDGYYGEQIFWNVKLADDYLAAQTASMMTKWGLS